jgi:hypothetical protein
MSLEAAIQENTATMHKLIAALAPYQHDAKQPGVNTAETVSDKLDRVEATVKSANTATAPAAKKTPPAKKEAPKAAAAEGTTLEQVAGVVTELAKAGKRAAVVAALKEFGVERASELKPEQFDDFLASLSAANSEAGLV